MEDATNILLQAADKLKQNYLAKITDVSLLEDLNNIRVAVLGKHGELTLMLKQISNVAAADRSVFGQHINNIKNILQQAMLDAQNKLELASYEKTMREDSLDVTMPGTGSKVASSHPITQVTSLLLKIFKSYGFTEVIGSEVEDDFHNFTALNLPKLHPARAMHDTFYLESGDLLRTHTSPAQIHAMENHEPPLRIISTGKVYRCDDVDMTHSPMFHQIEGLVVSENASFVEMKALLDDFFTKFFEKKIEVRFRPSYFPFTEPSAEVDIRMSKNSAWLEIMGCGMVHPNVFNHVDINPDKFTGYAFGVGIDRLAMLKYGIKDLRMLFENDMDFLSQF